MGSNNHPNNHPNNQCQSQPYYSLQNFPYGNFSSNANISFSQIPSFSSQPSSPPVQAASQPEKTPRERRLWTSKDDLVLISGWLYTSKDVIIGNDQRSGAFWKRIGEYYASSTHVLNGAEPRLPDHCRQRWQKIHRYVARFCGAYAEAVSEKASGMNDLDILKNAHQIYAIKYKKKFSLEYAWNDLRYEQKWINLEPMNPTSKTTSSNKRKANDAAPSSGSNVGEQESRPPGIKAMKAKRNKGKDKVGPALASDNMWEKKEKDMLMREKLQKMSVYNTLLAKNDTLDEDEKVLKKKLMFELF
ncbi:unnamed protein product [Arabidopsis lyrata]|nr:unnamed protein product [Arabidopsis lyrata]